MAYGIYLAFDWLGRHPVWTSLGMFVLVGTITIIWYLDHHRHR